MLRSSGVDEERKRQDKAVEQLQAAQASWSRKRTECLDFINEELCRQGHAVKTFRDVDAAMQEYAQVTRHNLFPLGPKPQLANFYHLSDGQKDRKMPSSSWGWPRPAWWPTDSLSNPCFIARLNFFDVGNMLAMLADELYLTIRHKIPGPLAHTMIDIVQKSLELWQQDERAAIRFAAGMLAGPTNLRATTGQLPEPVPFACWRLVRLLEYLSSSGRQ